jgi:hypothetical protein
MKNPKLEIREPKQIRNPNFENGARPAREPVGATTTGVAGTAGLLKRFAALLCFFLLPFAFCLSSLGQYSITWDGGGDGSSWNDSLNWSGDRLPVTNDVVAIGAGSGSTVTYAGSDTSIAGLSLNRPLVLSGGTLIISSNLDLNGDLTLAGGNLAGATVHSSTGRIIVTPANGTLDGVILNGDLTVQPDGELWLVNGLILNGTITMLGGRYPWIPAALNFPGTQTLDGTGQILFSGEWGNNYVRPVDGGQLTIAPAITLRTAGQPGVIGDATLPLVNQGSILAETNSITLVGANVVNQGVVQAKEGTLGMNQLENQGAVVLSHSTLTLDGSWTNAGTLTASNSTVNLGGVFTLAELGAFTRQGGTVNLIGTLNNTNAVLALNATTGSWQLNGGRINGGTMTSTDGTQLIVTPANGTLDGVILDGDLTVNPDGELWLINGQILNGTITMQGGLYPWVPAALNFPGTQTLDGTGQILFSGKWGNSYVRPVDDGQLTLGPAITLRTAGKPGVIGDATLPLVNQGSILAETNSITLAATTVENAGVLEAAHGGSITVQGTLTNSGQLLLGTAPGILEIKGDLDQLPAGAITVGLAGTTPGAQFSQLKVSVQAALAGNLDVQFSGGYVPSPGDAFTVLTYSSYSGIFSGLNLPASFNWQRIYAASSFTVIPWREFAIASPGGKVELAVTRQPGDSFTLLTSTNLAQPLEQWTPFLSHTLDASGYFSVTNAVELQTPQRFFILEFP